MQQVQSIEWAIFTGYLCMYVIHLQLILWQYKIMQHYEFHHDFNFCILPSSFAKYHLFRLLWSSFVNIKVLRNISLILNLSSKIWVGKSESFPWKTLPVCQNDPFSFLTQTVLSASNTFTSNWHRMQLDGNLHM